MAKKLLLCEVRYAGAINPTDIFLKIKKTGNVANVFVRI